MSDLGTLDVLSLQLDVDTLSHEYELFASGPRAGHRLSFNYSVASEQLGSEITASKLALSGAKRMPSSLSFNLQPFIFLDFGKGSSKALRFDANSFWSPGGGMQWNSVVGIFRVSAAYGFVTGPDHDHLAHLGRWHLYFSYGESF